jgi:hypothetical protein
LKKTGAPGGGNAYNFQEPREFEKNVDSSTIWCILDAHMTLKCSSGEINFGKR